MYKDYWHSALRDPEIENTLVDIRYDPFNAGKAYVYVRGQWLECISEYYSLFQGRSEKEIQLATAELKKQNQNHGSNYKIRAKQLGNFLANTEAVEIILEQRLRDEQVSEVFQVIEGGISNIIPFIAPSEPIKQATKIKSQSENLVEDNSTSDLVKPKKFRRFNKY